MGILIKNINVGNTDISNIGDGTLTGAIDTLNNLNENQIKFGIQNGQYGYYDANDNFVNFKTPTGTAEAAQVLSGYTFSNASSTGIQGAMVNRGAVASTINASQLYTIPAGYHNGSGYVRGQSLANQTTVDSGKTAAAAAQVLTGYQAWVNGSKISGSMVNRGSLKTTANAMSTVAIPAGYYDASTVVGQTLSGNAAATQVYAGRTFYNNSSVKQTGEMPVATVTLSRTATEAGAASTMIARVTSAGVGYANAGTLAEWAAVTANAGTPSGTTAAVTVNLTPNYYNKVTVNMKNAYNAGTAVGGAPTFTKIGTYGTTAMRPAANATSATFSATKVTGYKNLTSANFFPRITSVVYGHGTGDGNKGTYSLTAPPVKIAYTASSGLGTISNLIRRVGGNSEYMDCALLVALYCVH